MPSADQLLQEYRGDRRSVKMFFPGAIPDCKSGFDLVTTSGLPNVSSATAIFTINDVGKTFYGAGIGAAGADLLTTIITFTDSTHVVLGANAGASLTGKEYRYGTDWTSAINSGLNWLATSAKRGGILFFPRGDYLSHGNHAVSHMVKVQGECYSSVSIYGGGGITVDPASKITCVAPNPVFVMATNPCYAVGFEGIALLGIARSGSIGIHAINAWDLNVHECFFEGFGDHALLEESTSSNFSITSRLTHNFAQNCMLVRAGRTAYVGVFDVASTDIIIKENNLTASFQEAAGQIVTGFICSLVVRGANSFVHDNQLGHSEVGCYVDTTASYSNFIDARCDLNQSHGWVIASSKVGFTACRAHANSLDANHGWDGFFVTGSGNQFIGCRSTYNGSGSGVLFNQTLHAFETTNSNTSEINQFQFCYVDPGSNTGGDFVQSGSQVGNIWIDATGIDPLVGSTIRTRSNFSIMDDNSLFQIETTGPTDEKIWRQRMNYGSGFSEVLFSLLKDDLSAENPWLKCKRTGAVPTLATIFPLLSLLAGLQVTGSIDITSGHIEFDPSVTGIYVNNGNPNSVVTANGGSVCLDYGTSTFWVKTSGSGNTGWTAASTLTLPLSVVQGGTGQISLGADGVVIGQGTGSVAVTSAGTNGQFLAGVSGFMPTFRSLVLTDGPGPTGSVTLAKITGGGSNGTLFYNNGFISSVTPPT